MVSGWVNSPSPQGPITTPATKWPTTDPSRRTKEDERLLNEGMPVPW